MLVNRRTSAYTIAELLIVMTIIAILGTLAAPRYANAVARYRAESAAKRISADLLLAGSQARQLGKPVVVTFDTTGNTYTLAGVEDLRHRSGNYVVHLASEPYRAKLTSAAMGTISTNSVTFNIYGQPGAGGQVVISCGGYAKTIVLDQSSGRTTIQ